MDPLTDHDSPLSVTSSVAGILTFLVAILAAAYVRVSYLRNSDEEYLKVKTSLSWYKTESAWLAELLAAAEGGGRPGAPRRLETEYQMYAFVMDDLLRLEKRLLELVAETELRAAAEEATTTTGGGGGGAGGGSSLEKGAGKAGSIAERWVGVVTGSSAGAPWWRVTTGVAVAWLPVRAKALELVRQRDALTARVLFTQMSMVSSYVPYPLPPSPSARIFHRPIEAISLLTCGGSTFPTGGSATWSTTRGSWRPRRTTTCGGWRTPWWSSGARSGGCRTWYSAG